jgi:hypothetical protein
MEAVEIRLPAGDRWTYLCGQGADQKPTDVVVRAFGFPVLAAVGSGENTPDVEPILVPSGQGRRLVGRHFFARPADPAQGGLLTIRGC